MRTRRLFAAAVSALPAAAVAALALSLAGCGQTVAEIGATLDRNVLQTRIGRPYAEITARPSSAALAIAPEAPFGEAFASADLPGGHRLHRHLSRSVGETTTSDFFGLVSSRQERMVYRLYYFRVDQNGRVVDVANGVLRGEATQCVGYVGGLFSRCEDPGALAQDVAFFDTLVRTSAGETLASWGLAS